MIVPGARAPLCAREVCAPCSSGAVGVVEAPDKHVRAVGTSGAVDSGESWPRPVVVLEHVLGSAAIETGPSAVSPSHYTFIASRSRWAILLTWLGPMVTVDDSAKRRRLPKAYTRSRSDGRSRRATSAIDGIDRRGKGVKRIDY